MKTIRICLVAHAWVAAAAEVLATKGIDVTRLSEREAELLALEHAPIDIPIYLPAMWPEAAPMMRTPRGRRQYPNPYAR
jgi:hypothetical protein